MIQRSQSLYLLLVVLLSVLLLFLPVYEYGAADGLTALKSFRLGDNVLLSILNGAVALLSAGAIFLFKNRPLQIRISGLSMLITTILIGLLFFLADNMSTTLEQRLTYRYGAYLPILQLIFSFLAQRAIRKDEELVRSADRLR